MRLTLIASIDLTSNEGERNRAMLETLYGCGLRVSELVSLKFQIYFDEVCQNNGKGNKERFAHWKAAQKYIHIYRTA
jgi:integrase/recombinase XerD